MSGHGCVLVAVFKIKIKMVKIELSDLEALHFSQLMRPLAKSIEDKQVIEARANTPKEELQMDACSKVFVHCSARMAEISEEELFQQQIDYNRQFEFEQQQKKRNN